MDERVLGHHKMGILAIGRHDFEESVYKNACPTCGAPAFYWCRAETGKRLGTPHDARSGPPRRVKETR